MSEIALDLPGLKMWRPDKPLSVFELPDGYSIRTLANDEGELWCACIYNEMGVNEISQELFDKMMLEDKDYMDGSIFVVENERREPVATATALLLDGTKALLHMVSAREDHRGKGLGLAVCAAAIQKHRDAGYPECLLSTDDWRLGAIKQYLKLGFLPVLCHDSMRERWKIIAQKLKISVISCVNEDLTPADDIYALI